ncbi:MAG TPA: hypothetical protein VLT45_04350 [Kofleriaceae bacterium]|nr:hypothetical protein [Kofleriaceae bacterium]
MRQGTLLLALLFATACKIDLDHAPDAGTGKCEMSTSASCVEAVNHQDLTWIQDNVFTKQCTFSGCHNGENTKQGKIDLRAGKSFATLVNGDSALMPGTKLVVPGSPTTSYLEVMLGSEPGSVPASVGLMPQNTGGQLLCCQKLDAIQRWITAGAPNN